MKISTRTEYGIRVLVTLARNEGESCLSLSEIARREKLPHAYLEQLVGDLRRAGLVNATRGQAGGYSLARSASDIAMTDAVRALEGPLLEIVRRETGDVRCTNVHRLDRHALAVGEPKPIGNQNRLGRGYMEKTPEARAGRDDPKVECFALGPQSATAHVVGERRHRQLLRDLRLADERTRAVPPDEVPLAYEVVEGSPNGQSRDAEVRAQLALRRNGIADGELLDQVENKVASGSLLGHAAHRSPV